MKSASDLHRESETAREEDRHLDALKLIEEVIIEYQKERNYKGLVKAVQSRCLIYKHLFLLTNDEVFILLANSDADTSLKIANSYNLHDLFSSSYFRRGEITMIAENYEEAINNYKKALETYIGTDAEKGDYKYHLGTALYFKGDKKEGKELMLQGLKEIQDNKDQVDSFVANVWESGCYMRLAEVLKEDEPEKAKKYLELAKKIIDSDERLIIRKRQWEKLSRTFK